MREPLRSGTPTGSNKAPSRRPGYSFCIITHGIRPEKLRRAIGGQPTE